MVILLMTISNYFVDDYFRLNYHRLLLAIGGYCVL
jgi:hypothetical protein